MSLIKAVEDLQCTQPSVESNEFTYYDKLTPSQEDLTFSPEGCVQRDMWVVFYSPPCNGTWWSKRLHKGYGHCLTIQWDGFMWILTNHALDHTAVRVLPVESFDDVKTYIEQFHQGENFTWVHVKTQLNSDRPMRLKWLWTPYTCTELVKATLGIEDYFIWTPYQLYKYFKHNNLITEEQ